MLRSARSTHGQNKSRRRCSIGGELDVVGFAQLAAAREGARQLLDPDTKNDHPSVMSAALQLKKSLASAIRHEMEADNMSISTFAKRTKTARNSVRRILDGKNTSITLRTIGKAAEALNLEFTLTVRKLTPAKLGKIADQYAKATGEQEVARLEIKLLEGFYGKPIQQVYAKSPAV